MIQSTNPYCYPTLSDVAVVSHKSGKFRKKSSLSLMELACEPCIEILQEFPQFKDKIDCVLFSTTSPVQYSSAILSEYLGITPKISQRIDNLCNSGTHAIISAYSLIRSGLCDVALVVGADTSVTEGKKLVWDVTRGEFAFPIHWAALFAKSHMRKYGTTEEQMAMVSVKNRINAICNPNALFTTKITLDEVLESQKIADPVKLLECSYVCDGASAVIMTNKEIVRKISCNPVWINGIGTHTESASFARISEDLSSIHSAKIAANMAYKMAKIEPKDIDLVELHDAFTIMEILAYEDLGLTRVGQGGKFVTENQIVINSRGGLLGAGHPIGTTGIAQVVEVSEQLSGSAGNRQLKEPCNIGLVHNLAAAGSSAVVIVMGTQ
jgi:acetyl-CoA C-acetyltransferase